MRSKEEVLRSKAALFTDLNVPRVTHKEPLGSIVEKLKDAPEHTALVVNEANKLMGLITDQDVLKALSAPNLVDKVKRNEATAEDVMTPLAPEESTVARSSDSLEDVIEILQGRNRLNRPLKVVPIVDASGVAIGQVSRDSIQKNLDELLED